MKRITIFLMCALATMLACSCTKTSEGLTRITYYPVFSLIGDPEVSVLVGDTYTDAGCQVILNGEDVSSDAKMTSNVNTSEMGIYKVTYSYTNADGFSASGSRTVVVCNALSSFVNIYSGDSKYGTRHYKNAPVIITQDGANYLIDDLMGGFYWNGLYEGYEPTYDFHAEATLTLESDNTITLGTVGNWYFKAKNPTALTTGTFDPSTGTVVLKFDFGGDPFSVTLESKAKAL